MKANEIDTYTDLVRFLGGYTSWDQGFAYDPGGIFQLIAASLRNLKANAIDADLREINGYQDTGEKALLGILSKYARLPESD